MYCFHTLGYVQYLYSVRLELKLMGPEINILGTTEIIPKLLVFHEDEGLGGILYLVWAFLWQDVPGPISWQRPTIGRCPTEET
jgi:hypothetical protein